MSGDKRRAAIEHLQQLCADSSLTAVHLWMIADRPQLTDSQAAG
ncbi:hypothetical protein [Streptomyces sp. NPDC060022]